MHAHYKNHFLTFYQQFEVELRDSLLKFIFKNVGKYEKKFTQLKRMDFFQVSYFRAIRLSMLLS